MSQPIVRVWQVLLVVLCLAYLAPAQQGRGDAPPAGGLTALPEQVFERVPLVNGDFEGELAGWKVSLPEAFSVVAEGHAGKGAVRLDCGRKTPYVPSLRQALPSVGPGTYRLRVWARMQGIKVEKGLGGARVGVEWAPGDGRRAGTYTEILSGTRGWGAEEVWFILPPDMKPGSVAVSITRYGTPPAGEAVFDDITLERLVPPAVEAFLRHPNYRGYLPDDGPGRVRLWVGVHDAKLNEPVRVEARAEEGGKVVATAVVPADVKEQIVELDARDWPAGRYLVQAVAGAYRYPAYAVQKITAAQRKEIGMWFDENSVLHMESGPVFPIGLYNTILKFGTIDDSEMDRMKKMAEAPVNFNINYTAWPNDTATRRRYLGEMRKQGMWFLDTVNNVHPQGAWGFPIFNELMPEAGKKLATQEVVDQYLTRLGAAMRDMPGHAGWYVMDERDFGEVPRHFHQYDVLRKADPSHPTYGVSNRPAEVACWRDALDVFGLDPYPLMNMKAGEPLGLAGQWTRAGVDATQGSRPVWMVLQFFQGWSTDRWPTEEELRTMSLMAIAEGARGLFYWSFGGRALASAKASEREEYWQRLVKVTKEIKALEPALLAADAPGAVREMSDSRIRWRARVAEGKCYVFAWLPAEKRADEPTSVPPVSVRFTMADGSVVTRQIRPDGADWFAVPAPSTP